MANGTSDEKNKMSKIQKIDNKCKNVDNNLNRKNEVKITPAYMKKDQKQEGKHTKKWIFNNLSKKEKKRLLVIVISVIILISIIIGVILSVRASKYKPYKSFEEEMNVYGFTNSYNNKRAKSSDKVTKSEAIKLVLSTVLNTNNISGFAKDIDDPYENSMWVEYAKYLGIIGDTDITKDNAKDRALYIDVIRYFANAKVKLLDKELASNNNIKIKDILKYKPDEQVAIEDMISNEVITVNTKKISGKRSLFKGKLNELCVNFALKYNTITLNYDKVNINEDKMPSNKSDYPYTLSNVDKDVYEKEFDVDDKSSFKTPKELYSIKKEYYSQIEEIAEGYFNTILNINYNSIDYDKLSSKIFEYSLYGTEGLKEYVEYVKENKIIIEGNSKVMFPAVYFDGVQYVVRMKLDFKIKNALTKDDVLYIDLVESSNSGKNIHYDEDSYTIYIDAKMGDTLGGSDAIYINSMPVINLILDKDTKIERK